MFSAKYRAALTASSDKENGAFLICPALRDAHHSASRPVFQLALDLVLDCISTVFVVGSRSGERFMDLFGLARVKGAWMAFSPNSIRLHAMSNDSIDEKEAAEPSRLF